MEVSDATRNDTWGLLLDLERQVRYYLRLADRYTLTYRTIRYGLLVGILLEAAVVYFSAGQPLLLWTIGGLGAALLGFATIFDAVTNYAETSSVLRLTAELCDEIKVEAERLWRDIESGRVEDADAEERYNGIVNRWSLATSRVKLEVHHPDNVKAAKEAYEVLASRYAK